MPSVSTVFVDTNVLLYSEDRADEAKHQAARAWLRVLWSSRRGRLSSQVLHEFYVNATRKLRPPLPAGDARAEVRRYQRWQPWPVDHATVETAWAVESRFGLSYWDALMVAAAVQQGCELLLTEDLQHGQQIDGVRIVNPFVTGPEILDKPVDTPA
jgi:predicted nucleic acid-binding protein